MSVLQRNRNVEEAPLQNELMLFNPSSSQFYMLNRTMAYIWKNCEGKDEDELIAGVIDSFDAADRDTAAADVRKALDDLLSLGLVVDGPAVTA